MPKQQFNIRISRYELIFLTFIHWGAVVVILLLKWPLVAHIFGVVIVLASWIIGVLKAAGGRRIVSLQYQDPEWVLSTARGDSFISHLRGDSFVSPSLLVLRFNRSDIKKSYSILILPDCMSKDDFRQLKVLTRFASQI